MSVIHAALNILYRYGVLTKLERSYTTLFTPVQPDHEHHSHIRYRSAGHATHPTLTTDDEQGFSSHAYGGVSLDFYR